MLLLKVILSNVIMTNVVCSNVVLVNVFRINDIAQEYFLLGHLGPLFHFHVQFLKFRNLKGHYYVLHSTEYNH